MRPRASPLFAAATADIVVAVAVILAAAAGTSVAGFAAADGTMVSATAIMGRGIITPPAIAAGSS